MNPEQVNALQRERALLILFLVHFGRTEEVLYGTFGSYLMEPEKVYLQMDGKSLGVYQIIPAGGTLSFGAGPIE